MLAYFLQKKNMIFFCEKINMLCFGAILLRRANVCNMALYTTFSKMLWCWWWWWWNGKCNLFAVTFSPSPSITQLTRQAKANYTQAH